MGPEVETVVLVVPKRFSSELEVLGGVFVGIMVLNAWLVATGREPVSYHTGKVMREHPREFFGTLIYLLLHFAGVAWLRWFDPLGYISRGWRYFLSLLRSNNAGL